eukprot:5141662-Prymnesium_polylepis.1
MSETVRFQASAGGTPSAKRARGKGHALAYRELPTRATRPHTVSPRAVARPLPSRCGGAHPNATSSNSRWCGSSLPAGDRRAVDGWGSSPRDAAHSKRRRARAAQAVAYSSRGSGSGGSVVVQVYTHAFVRKFKFKGS